MNEKEIAVIGAGPAGLTVAHFLQELGCNPTVYEGSNKTGGLAGSIDLWGRSYDIGPHIFLESSQKEAVDFWKLIAGNNLRPMNLERGMCLNNKIIVFPPSPLSLLQCFGFPSFFLAAGSVLKERLSGSTDFNSAGSFFQKRYGKVFRNKVFNPFCEKYMGICDLMVEPDFAFSLTSFVKDSGRTDVTHEESQMKNLLYPTEGVKVIWSRLTKMISEKNELQLNKRLDRVITEGNKIKELHFSDGAVSSPQYVVSTLPVNRLLNSLDNVPDDILQLTKAIVFRNTVLVYLRTKDKAFKKHYITVFDHSTEAGRISNFSFWKDPEYDRSDETVLCVEYWCGSNDVNWNCSNEAIVSKCVEEMARLKLIIKENFIEAQVMRLANSHPVLDNKYRNSLNKINTYLSQFENLSLTGRHASFKWDGQADNIVAGKRLAEKISRVI